MLPSSMFKQAGADAPKKSRDQATGRGAIKTPGRRNRALAKAVLAATDTRGIELLEGRVFLSASVSHVYGFNSDLGGLNSFGNVSVKGSNYYSPVPEGAAQALISNGAHFQRGRQSHERRDP